MLKVLFQVIVVLIASVAGYLVWTNMAEFFDDWVSYAIAVLVFAAVFSAIYFPIAAPLAHLIGDRVSILRSRIRDTRTGTGIDTVPMTNYDHTKQLEKCAICGHPGGPVCDSCKAILAQKRQTK